MARKSKIEIKESIEDLKRIYLTAKNDRVRLKVKSLILLKENKLGKQERIAIHLGISFATLKRWLKEYNEHGLSFLLTLKTKGKPKSFFDAEVNKKLQERFNDKTKPFSGYCEIKDWLLVEFGLDLKYATVRNYMIKHFKCKRITTKHTNYIRSGKAVK